MTNCNLPCKGEWMKLEFELRLAFKVNASLASIVSAARKALGL